MFLLKRLVSFLLCITIPISVSRSGIYVTDICGIDYSLLRIFLGGNYAIN